MTLFFLSFLGTFPAFARTLEMLGLLISLKLVALAPIGHPAPGSMGAFSFFRNGRCDQKGDYQ